MSYRQTRRLSSQLSVWRTVNLEPRGCKLVEDVHTYGSHETGERVGGGKDGR